MVAGETEHVCGLHDSTHALKNGPRPALKNGDWKAVKTLQSEDRRLPVSRRKTSNWNHRYRCGTTNSGCPKAKWTKASDDDSTVLRLNSHVVVVFFFRSATSSCCSDVAPVDEKSAGKLPDLPLIDEDGA